MRRLWKRERNDGDCGYGKLYPRRPTSDRGRSADAGLQSQWRTIATRDTIGSTQLFEFEIVKAFQQIIPDA